MTWLGRPQYPKAIRRPLTMPLVARKPNPVIVTFWAKALAMAEPSEAERNLNKFKALPLERQRAILHVETSDEVFGPMSLFDCAVEVPRAAKEIRQRFREGLNVGASFTQRYEYCTFRYFRTDTPAQCKVTQATIRKLLNPTAVRDALGDAYNACKK